MRQKFALKIILIISFIGILFSGFLSYRELFLGSCSLNFISCGTQTGPILGIPACIYGFVMYMLLFIVALLGYKSRK